MGPGPGLLTRHLLATGAAVRTVEIDARVEVAARQLIEPELQSRLHWVTADALDGPRRLAPELQAVLAGATAFVANLPYNAAASIVTGLIGHPDCPARVVVMVQHEVAERLLAGAGGRQYGPISVLCHLAGSVRVLRRVPPQAFWPVPEVDSDVVELRPRPGRPLGSDLDVLGNFLRGAFRERRKTLLNSLARSAGITSREALARLSPGNLPENVRAESIAPIQLQVLAQAWAANAPSVRNRS